jgi:hypothetical protein
MHSAEPFVEMITALNLLMCEAFGNMYFSAPDLARLHIAVDWSEYRVFNDARIFDSHAGWCFQLLLIWNRVEESRLDELYSLGLPNTERCQH